ncbi:MAG: preprotein translocase subunit YajC [Actinomycetota bacterium]
MSAALIAQQSGSNVTFLISLVLMVAIFYFLLIRPQQRRTRQQRQLVESLRIGDEVITIGGMFGTILDMDDETITLDAGAGTRLKYLRQAVARKFVEETETEEEEAGE